VPAPASGAGASLGLGRIAVPSDESAGALPIAPGTPLRPIYQTEDEYAEELSNRTVHSVMHLGRVELDDGRYQGQMAVLVTPRGRLGEAYMALIKPFRYALVYPRSCGRSNGHGNASRSRRHTPHGEQRGDASTARVSGGRGGCRRPRS
jgi:hypothetical protein